MTFGPGRFSFSQDDQGPCPSCEWLHYCRKTGDECQQYRYYAALMPWHDMKATPDGVLAAHNAAAIVEELKAARKPLTVTDLKARLGLTPNVIGAALKTLHAEKRVRKNRKQWSAAA